MTIRAYRREQHFTKVRFGMGEKCAIVQSCDDHQVKTTGAALLRFGVGYEVRL